ncbi:MAG TPA: hypothetical protein VND62_07585, partial [Acidimicrobiales bacterium]|nr:hypothetical protein [Acidimicrobiales bacterium]
GHVPPDGEPTAVDPRRCRAFLRALGVDHTRPTVRGETTLTLKAPRANAFGGDHDMSLDLFLEVSSEQVVVEVKHAGVLGFRQANGYSRLHPEATRVALVVTEPGYRDWDGWRIVLYAECAHALRRRGDAETRRLADRLDETSEALRRAGALALEHPEASIAELLAGGVSMSGGLRRTDHVANGQFAEILGQLALQVEPVAVTTERQVRASNGQLRHPVLLAWQRVGEVELGFELDAQTSGTLRLVLLVWNLAGRHVSFQRRHEDPDGYLAERLAGIIDARSVRASSTVSKKTKGYDAGNDAGSVVMPGSARRRRVGAG